MKKIFRNLMMLLCALTALVSCDESGDKIYLDGFKASGLMASASDVVLSVDNTKDIVLSMVGRILPCFRATRPSLRATAC